MAGAQGFGLKVLAAKFDGSIIAICESQLHSHIAMLGLICASTVDERAMNVVDIAISWLF